MYNTKLQFATKSIERNNIAFKTSLFTFLEYCIMKIIDFQKKTTSRGFIYIECIQYIE